MRKTCSRAAILGGVAAMLVISCFQSSCRKSQVPSTNIVGRAGEKITESIPVPEKKYPNGFPIEILEYSEKIEGSRRFFSARCAWHPESDSALGGKPAVVPVTVVRLDEKTKTIISLVTIVSQPDGFFTASIPDTAGSSAKYSLAVRIEYAKDCPERFKKRLARPQPQKRI